MGGVDAAGGRRPTRELAAEHAASLEPGDWSPGERAAFERPPIYYVGLCVRRKCREVRGDPAMYVSKLVSTTIVGLATGTVFRDVAYADFGTKYGLAFSAVVTIGLGGMSSIGGLMDRRATFYKQRDASFFPTSAYVAAEVLVDLPFVFLEALVYANAARRPRPGRPRSSEPSETPLPFRSTGSSDSSPRPSRPSSSSPSS